MKIMINYDLIDKARESKTGFSLHKYTRVVGFTNGIAIPAMLLGAYIGNVEASYVIESILRLFGYSLFYNALNAFVFSSFRKGQAGEIMSVLFCKNILLVLFHMRFLMGNRKRRKLIHIRLGDF